MGQGPHLVDGKQPGPAPLVKAISDVLTQIYSYQFLKVKKASEHLSINLDFPYRMTDRLTVQYQ